MSRGSAAVEANSLPTPKSASPRLHSVDFARGIACLSMPIFHSVYNLYQFGFIDTALTKTLFWVIYQKMGLGTFVLVSGMAFTLSTQSGIRWNRLLRRVLKLGSIALAISVATYFAEPTKFVRFGVIHFFTSVILIAMVIRPMKQWLIIPGLIIVAVAVYVGRGGIDPNPLLYITGLMSQRPSSIDYIPLIPWLGVFMIGMGIANWFTLPKDPVEPSSFMRPVIWLGKHSLPFYILHQIVLYAVFYLIALLINLSSG
jgi:uncharacterized membrane protein